jgi:Flp pilus assembly protein TadD
MRLLLLLSAFLTALTGVVVGTAASAQPIQASASATHAKPGTPVKVTAPLPEEVQGAYAAPGTWHVRLAPSVRISRTPYGERRRE